VLSADGEVHFLETDACLPLGIDATVAPSETIHPLAAGDSLVLFTDGLVERRDESMETGFDRLRTALHEGPRDVEALCDHVLEQSLGDHPSHDDVAVLIVRLLGQPVGPLDLTFPATAESVPVVRHRLRAWLSATAEAVDAAVAQDLELACSEACTNAVRHAYGPADATFSVRADLHDGEVVLEVRDQGSWREPRGAQGGWGLRLIRAVCDAVEVDRRRDGTRVHMHRDLRSPAPAAGVPTA
jgi:anti-sigma regulatory factor (Ser/Thr protein kinase)